MNSWTPESATSIDLASLPVHLDRLATPAVKAADESSSSFLHRLADCARQTMRAEFVICQRVDCSQSPASPTVIDQASAPSSAGDAASAETISRLARLAAESDRTQIEQQQGRCLIATVANESNDRRTVVVTSLALGSMTVEPFVVTQQLITSTIVVRDARLAHETFHRLLELQQWTDQLRRSIEQSDTLKQVVDRVVDAIAIRLGLHQVAFCQLRGNRLSRIRVIGVGGQGTSIADSDWLAAASEALVRGTLTQWDGDSPDRSPATLAHQELARCISPQHWSFSVILRGEDGRAYAVLVGVSEEAVDRELLSEICETVSQDVDRWRFQNRTFTARALDSLRSWLRTRLALFIGVLVIIGVGMLPVPYRVSATATVVPKTRSFAVAPHSGLIREANFRVGDIVRQGDAIAELDGRELRIEMASLLAQLDRARKERDIQRAGGNVAEEQLAEFDLAHVEQQIKLTQHRLQNLVVLAPIDGVVLDGSLEELSGAPVETGQLLAEVALLDQLWIELHVPENELSEVREGQAMRVAFDAMDGSVIEAQVDSVAPSAQVRDGENVFIVRASVNNPNGLLRPGIRGNAKLNSDDRPLAAVLLRQVWRRICGLWI